MKAQTSQVFTIIFALIIMATIVLFATKGIGNLLDNKCTADYAAFASELKKTISDSKDYGSLLKHNPFAPCDYTYLCFVSSQVDSIDPKTPYDDLNTVMGNSIGTNNIFIYDGKEVKLVGYMDEIVMDSDYFCIERKASRFTFITEGQGRTVKIQVKEEEESDIAQPELD